MRQNLFALIIIVLLSAATVIGNRPSEKSPNTINATELTKILEQKGCRVHINKDGSFEVVRVVDDFPATTTELHNFIRLVVPPVIAEQSEIDVANSLAPVGQFPDVMPVTQIRNDGITTDKITLASSANIPELTEESSAAEVADAVNSIKAVLAGGERGGGR